MDRGEEACSGIGGFLGQNRNGVVAREERGEQLGEGNWGFSSSFTLICNRNKKKICEVVRTVIDNSYWESFGGEREVKCMKEHNREMLKPGVIDLQQPSTINLLDFFL